MKTYTCSDEGAQIEIQADSAYEAAREYVDTGDWEPRNKTDWIHVSVKEEGEEDWETFKIELDPEIPECRDGEDHEWDSPHEIVGGIKENPGVWGHGGGVIINECCMKCGCGKKTNTWDQDPSTGEQGLESVEYEKGKYSDALEEMNDL